MLIVVSPQALMGALLGTGFIVMWTLIAVVAFWFAMFLLIVAFPTLLLLRTYWSGRRVLPSFGLGISAAVALIVAAVFSPQVISPNSGFMSDSYLAIVSSSLAVALGVSLYFALVFGRQIGSQIAALARIAPTEVLRRWRSVHQIAFITPLAAMLGGTVSVAPNLLTDWMDGRSGFMAHDLSNTMSLSLLMALPLLVFGIVFINAATQRLRRELSIAKGVRTERGLIAYVTPVLNAVPENVAEKSRISPISAYGLLAVAPFFGFFPALFAVGAVSAKMQHEGPERERWHWRHVASITLSATATVILGLGGIALLLFALELGVGALGMGLIYIMVALVFLSGGWRDLWLGRQSFRNAI